MPIRCSIIKMLLLLFVVTAPFSLYAQAKWNSAYQHYIDEFKDMAIEQMIRHKVPASITLAQGLLESGAGKSRLATYGNNHFGIKCHDWTGKSMRLHDDLPDECFRVYGHPRESYEDHSLFLKRPRYSKLFSLSITDYKGWAKGLKACGYATNPSYAQSLITIIELYKLYQYDHAKSFDKFIASHAGIGVHGHQIYSYNKNYYIKARKGDTFKSLSEEMGISRRKLAKYNERDKNDEIQEGDIIYLKKKRSSAPKDFKKHPHVVKHGESMYSIAQLYGIRLKSLYKKNDLDADYMPRVGDKLKVY